MRAALQEAIKAFETEEVPVGAIVVRQGRVIGRGHNLREKLKDPMYATLEPCPMCAGAIVNARIRRLVYAADDPKAGACGTLFNVVQDSRLNHRVEISRGVLADEASALLKEFFRQRRGAKE
jgi:tRNA(adenine34) deaminase